MAGQYYYGPGLGEGLAMGVKSGFDAYDAQKQRQRLGLKDARDEEAEKRQQAAEARAQEEFDQKKKLWPEQEKRAALDTQNAEITRDSNLLSLSGAQMDLGRKASDNQFATEERGHKKEMWPSELTESQAKANKAKAEADQALQDHQYQSMGSALGLIKGGNYSRAVDLWNVFQPDDPIERIDPHPAVPGAVIVRDRDGDVHEFSIGNLEKIVGAYNTNKQAKTARGQKIQGLLARGYNQQDAEDLADGRVRLTSPDQFGDVYTVNVTDGTRRKVQGLDTSTPDSAGLTIPSGPVQPPAAIGTRRGLDVDAAASEGTGPFAAIRQGLNNTLGVFMTGQPFPQTEAARNTLRLFDQEVKQSLVNSDRFPVHEQKLVESMLPSPDRIMTDPDGERQKVVQLHQFLTEKRAQNEQNLRSGRITTKDRGILMDQNAAIDRTLGLMGPVSGQSTGPGVIGGAQGGTSIDAGVARPQSRAEYQSLPAGSQYIAPDGTIRTKR